MTPQQVRPYGGGHGAQVGGKADGPAPGLDAKAAGIGGVVLGRKGAYPHSGYFLLLLQRDELRTRLHRPGQALQRSGGGVDGQPQLLGQYPHPADVVGVVMGD